MSAQSDTATPPELTAALNGANRRAGVLITVVVAVSLGLSWTAMADRPKAVATVAAAAEQAVAMEAPTTIAAAVETTSTLAGPLDTTIPILLDPATSAAPAPVAQAPSNGASPTPAAAAPMNGPSPAPAGETVPPPTAPPTTPPTAAPAVAPTVTPAPSAAPPAPTVAPTVAPTAAPTTTPPATAAPTAVAPPQLFTYDFAGVATSIVIAQYADRHIELVSVTKVTGWVSQVENNGPNSIEIKFFNTTTHAEAKFAVERDGTRLKVSKES